MGATLKRRRGTQTPRTPTTLGRSLLFVSRSPGLVSAPSRRRTFASAASTMDCTSGSALRLVGYARNWTAGFSPCFHLPGIFLTHSQLLFELVPTPTNSFTWSLTGGSRFGPFSFFKGPLTGSMFIGGRVPLLGAGLRGTKRKPLPFRVLSGSPFANDLLGVPRTSSVLRTSHYITSKDRLVESAFPKPAGGDFLPWPKSSGLWGPCILNVAWAHGTSAWCALVSASHWLVVWCSGLASHFTLLLEPACRIGRWCPWIGTLPRSAREPPHSGATPARSPPPAHFTARAAKFDLKGLGCLYDCFPLKKNTVSAKAQLKESQKEGWAICLHPVPFRETNWIPLKQERQHASRGWPNPSRSFRLGTCEMTESIGAGARSAVF